MAHSSSGYANRSAEDGLLIAGIIAVLLGGFAWLAWFLFHRQIAAGVIGIQHWQMGWIGHVTDRYALLRDGVVTAPFFSPFQCKSIEPRNIQPMGCRPPVQSFAYVSGHLFVMSDLREQAGNALLCSVMHLGKTHHGYIHTLIGDVMTCGFC